MNLSTELTSVGADAAEANELIKIAERLSQMKLEKNIPSRSHSVLKLNLLTLASTWVATLAAGAFLVIVSQTVLPNSLLYPLQKISDGVAVDINSGYRGTVMMKQAQQVKQLVAEHASSSTVMATLANYQLTAKAYSREGSDYAIFEYCKDNLSQAAAMASNSERVAINRAVYNLKNI